MTEREALKLALEALELSNANHWWGSSSIEKAITAIKEALMSGTDGAQPQPWEKFCDSNCVWTDHHPDCKLAERLPLPAFTTGHCKEKAKEGGCQLHNIQCGFPACDRKES